MKLLSTLVLAATLCGCATKNGRCFPIIGFGWVTINTNQPEVTVVKATLLGAGVTTLPPAAIIGFNRSSTALVTTNGNVLLEIK
jgi:hypothetical protein